MGQQPEDRLDEDLEIDSDTAENVTGGVHLAFESKNLDGKKEPGAPVLYRIAKRYGKSIEWLLTGVEGKSQ